PATVGPARTGCRAVRTALSWRGILPFTHPRTGGAHDSLHRTAGIAGRTRRRGRVAARGARAASRDCRQDRPAVATLRLYHPAWSRLDRGCARWVSLMAGTSPSSFATLKEVPNSIPSLPPN